MKYNEQCRISINKKLFRNFFLAMAALILLAVSCTPPSIGELEEVSQQGPSILPGNIVETETSYIVEGDMEVHKDSPGALEIALNLASSSSPLAGQIDSRGNINPYKWSATDRLDITYSYDTSMSMDEYSDAHVKRMIEEALKTYKRMCNVNFRKVSSGGKLRFAKANAANGWTGMATTYYYYSGDIISARVQLNYYYMKNNSKGRMMYTIYHEIGHTLGLAHEHQRADSPYQYGQGTSGTPYGPYDSKSIMDYANRGEVSVPSTGDINTLKYMYGSNPDIYTSPWVTDLQIIVGGSSSITAPPGYTKINVDLNKRAGGKYIYLCYTKLNSRTNQSWVDAIDAFTRGSTYTSDTFGSYKPVFSATSKGIQADCNEGSGGDYIYVVQRNSTAGRITNVSVIAGGSSSIQPPPGWRKVNVDLNRGAGGDYIYVVYN